MTDYRELFRTGPDTPGGRYMRLFWHPVYRAEDLKPGWAKPIKIMSEQFTLYRGEAGNGSSRSVSLCSSRTATFRRLDRGRLYPLPLSRLEIRRNRTVCRDAD